MPASSQYHVILDGQGYLIDLASYHKRVADPFAPKRRAGDPGYGDLEIASVWAQENWQRGFGVPDPWAASTLNAKLTALLDDTPLAGTPPARLAGGYAAGSYRLDSHFGDLRMGRNLLTEYNNLAILDIGTLIVWKGALYAIRLDGQEVLKSTDGATWNVDFNSGKTALGCTAVHNNKLAVGSGSDNEIMLNDGLNWLHNWSLPAVGNGFPSLPTNITAMATWHVGSNTDYLFFGAQGPNGANSTAAQLGKIDYTGTPTFVAQFRDPKIEALIAWNNQLWIATSDTTGSTTSGRLYAYDGSKHWVVTDIPDNFITSFCAYNGQLYAGSRTRGIIWTVSSMGLSQVWAFPGVAGIGGVSTYGIGIRSMAVDGGRLHVPIVDTNGLGTYVYDGVGWDNISAGGSGQEPRGIAPFLGDLYLSNKSNAGARIYKIERKSPTSAMLLTNKFTAGLAAEDKLWLTVELYHAALNANESIVVDYQLSDSGTYSNAGTANSAGSESEVFSFPTATKSKSMRLRVSITVTDQTKSPVIKSILVRHLVESDPKALWQFDALLEGTAQAPLKRIDLTPEPLTGAQLSAALWASRAKKQTLAFTDYNGDTKSVHLRHLDEQIAPASQRQGQATIARVTLLEA